MTATRGERSIWIAVVIAAFFIGWAAAPRDGGRGDRADATDTAAPPTPTSPGATSASGEPTGNTADVTSVPVPADRSPAAIRGFARETLEEAHALTRYKMLIGLLNNLTAENWEEVADEFARQTAIDGRRQPMEWFAFLIAAGEVAGKDAMLKFYDARDINSCRTLLSGWAAADPQGAIDWLEDEADAAVRDRIWGAALKGIAQTQPDIAVNLLEQLPPADRRSYTNDLMPIMIQAVGVDESTRLFEDMAQRAAEQGDAREAYLSHMFGQLANRRLANSRDTNTTAETAAWVAGHVGEPYVDRTIVAGTAGQLSSENPDAALSWLDSLGRLPAGSAEPAGYASVVRSLTASSGPDAAGAWLDKHRDHPHYGRLVIPHAGNVAAQNPEAAQMWIDSITDPVLRQRAVDEVRRRTGGN